MADGERYTFANAAAAPAGIADTIRTMIEGWDAMGESWREVCHPDIDFTLGNIHTVGVDAAAASRASTFHPTNGPLTNVSHVLKELYPKAGHPDGATQDVVFTGTVTYTVLGGKDMVEDFATFYRLLKQSEGTYKIKTARIYINTVALTQAMAELQKQS
ncbi:uncharacterized protein HMPREF1541_09226 [Cyphellophora europaea CBS 101466]|uniref:SnoaL-like domain-containing protein n=1 Tax=Cyphellophora europaea (strain CBS 101466) TaxID=1220924 RepID=W2S9U8_CYPE1|nr:uncharacterized protein HMPREF1541_09226 [Cyphellophora europaea CBS 101466]ETN45395.1 hypothetical protein HMPREF1541_09226 [Cyphellophora europaea CBS 101466]